MSALMKMLKVEQARLWVRLCISLMTRECSPFRLLLLGLVAILNAAIRDSMSSGDKKMTKVKEEFGSNCIDWSWEN